MPQIMLGKLSRTTSWIKEVQLLRETKGDRKGEGWEGSIPFGLHLQLEPQLLASKQSSLSNIL